MDHPEPAANPAIQKALDGMEKRPVRFLLNTHWHYDHVGGNAVYGPEAIIVAFLPDTGMRYLSKVYNDEWMRERNYGDSAVKVTAGEIVHAKHNSQMRGMGGEGSYLKMLPPHLARRDCTPR